ncbi:hypothetical protein LX36DRAFT_587052, partial [Colletotrichum falcatum]
MLTDTAIHPTEGQDNDHLPTNANANAKELPHEGTRSLGQPTTSALRGDAAIGIVIHHDAATRVAKGTSGDKHQDPATSTRATGNNIRRTSGADSKSSQPQPVRRARTAQEYTATMKRKSEQELKKDFIRQIGLKRRSGVSGIILEPPKAKRRRLRKASISSLDDSDEAAASTMTGVMPELGGGIPTFDQPKVSKKDRRKQIAAATSGGDSNRHLSSQKDDAKTGLTIWGLGHVDCVGSSDYKLKGMKTPIRGWQLQAATRMVLRENSHGPPHGGILGDQMGMGKTLTSLVLIVGCPPLHQDTQAGCGGSLVVVPGPNVLKEWSDAISCHTDVRPQDFLVYKRGTNIFEASQIAGYKIVLTTYQELLKYPSGKKLSDLAMDHGQGTREFQDAVRNAAGPIFDIEWYRIVFDELHTIKNSETQTFQACYHLNSKRIWGLSGTPLINQSKEIFPYLKLIRVEGITTKKDFESVYKKAPDAAAKLDALINLVTMRRSHDDYFLGKQMLEGIPQFEAEVRWVNLSQEERLIYDTIGRYFDSQPRRIVSMALKRQAISHPYLLENTFLEAMDNGSIQKLIDSLKKVEGNAWVYHQIGRRCGRHDPDNALEASKSDPEEVPDLTPREVAYAPMNPFGKSAFGGEFSMAHLLELTIMEKEMGKKTKCGWCSQKKRVRMRINGAEEYAKEDNESSDEDSDGNRVHGRKNKISEKKRKAQARRERKTMTRRKYGGDFIGTLPGLEEDGLSFIRIGVNENGGIPCPGTKLTVAKEIILQWQKEAPNDKIIVFVEFLKTAVMLGIVLNLEEIPFVYLNGKITSTEKLKAVEAFKTNPEVKILVS